MSTTAPSPFAPANVPLTETFTSPTWDRYTTAAPFTTATFMGRQSAAGYPWSLATLNHIDVRTFNSLTDPLATPENWQVTPSNTSVELGPNSSYNNWRLLAVNLTEGIPVTLFSIADSLDLTVIGDGTYLQSALVNSSYADLNLETSTIGLSSDGGETWDTQTLEVCLESDTDILHVLLGNFATVDLTNVNGVQLHLVPTAAVTFAMTGLRVVDPNYKPSTIMMDTWNGILRQDIPFDGNIAENPPVANQQLPVIYYAASTGGSDDPQPIDTTFSINFNTGGNVGVNSFRLNLRQVGGTDTSQLLLEDQSQLNLSGQAQPGLIQTAEIPRRMSDFQGQPMTILQGQSMLNLDATAEAAIESYTVFQVSWGNTQLITIADSVSLMGGQYLPYVWSYPTLSAYTTYQAVCALEENSVRIQIYDVDQATLAQESLIFDSGSISDSYQFPRRPGRIGWSANFTDGEAHLINIRPEYTLFAEYQSAPLNSRTPVKGAQVYATYSPDVELWSDFTASPADSAIPTVSLDSKRSITGSATKVYIGQQVANQGIISNVLSPDDITGITEWGETTINFSVWVPSSAALTETTTLQANLISDKGGSVPLSFPSIQYNTWQPITFDGPDIPSGLYQLQIIYPGTTPMTFWVDAVSVTQRVLSWAARANPSDPWVPFNGLISDSSNGVLINRGTQLQVRAQAKRQDAAILAKPKVKPIFAQFGKAVWPEDVAAFTNPYTAVLATTSSAITSEEGINSLPVEPLSNNQATILNQISNSIFMIGTGEDTSQNPLTLQYEGAQQSVFWGGVEVSAGATSIPYFEMTANVTFPAGSTLTWLGADISTSHLSGRTYSFESVLNSAPFAPFITQHIWQFSDGSIQLGTYTTHTFSAIAPTNTVYQVTLTTVDVYGGRSTHTVTIEVS